MELDQQDQQPNLSAIGRRIHERLAALEPYDRLRTQAQRYELWAENLGLYQLGHSSLDYRFRDAPSIYTLTHRLLSHLMETLPTLEEIAASGDFGPSKNIVSPIGSAGAKPSGARDEEEDSDGDLDSDEEEMLASYENESLTDMISARLESIIDRLYRLSFRIRSPATRLGVSKASRYRDVDESTNIDLMDMYAEVDRRHIRELLKQISGASADDGNDHYLVSRLSQANTLRRKQFGQWGRHRSKLKGSSQPKQAETLPKLTDGSNKPRALLLPGNKAPSRPSTATMIVDRHIDLDDNKSVISTSTYIQLHDADATGVFMPPPPTVPIYRKEFECPYCHILCSRKTLEKQAWEYHVVKDLRPYTCTFEDCDTGGQLYDSLKDWLSHEVQLHKADINQRRCPFCLANASNQHIAEHLRRVALFALPRSTGLESASDGGGSANAQLDLGSKDSELSSLVFSSTYDSGDEADMTKHRIPGAALTNDALKAVPGKTEGSLLDYLSSDRDNGTDVNAQGEEYGYLTTTYLNQGRWDEAEKLQMQVMETRKRTLGEEHPDTLSSIANLAAIYRRHEHFEKAEELQVQVTETRKRVLGEEHPDTLESIAQLAKIYWSQDRWKEAEELHLQMIETGKRALGEEHPVTLASIAQLADIYWSQDRWKEAEELHLQMIERMKRVLGEEHPITLESMNNLVSAYMGQERWKAAEKLEVRLVELKLKVFGKEYPDTLNSISCLATIYSYQGRWKEAEELELQALETKEKVLGEEHPDTQTSMDNLVLIYRWQGRWKEVEELEARKLEIRTKLLAEVHPRTLAL